MPKRRKVFKILGVLIILLVVFLIAINILYIKESCSSRQCLVISLSTIALLLWVTAFWVVVLRYSRKD